MSVDFPAPLSPTRPTTSPDQTSKSTSRKACTAPNALLVPVSSKAGSPLRGGASAIGAPEVAGPLFSAMGGLPPKKWACATNCAPRTTTWPRGTKGLVWLRQRCTAASTTKLWRCEAGLVLKDSTSLALSPGAPVPFLMRQEDLKDRVDRLTHPTCASRHALADVGFLDEAIGDDCGVDVGDIDLNHSVQHRWDVGGAVGVLDLRAGDRGGILAVADGGDEGAHRIRQLLDRLVDRH